MFYKFINFLPEGLNKQTVWADQLHLRIGVALRIKLFWMKDNEFINSHNGNQYKGKKYLFAQNSKYANKVVLGRMSSQKMSSRESLIVNMRLLRVNELAKSQLIFLRERLNEARVMSSKRIQLLAIIDHFSPQSLTSSWASKYSFFWLQYSSWM